MCPIVGVKNGEVRSRRYSGGERGGWCTTSLFNRQLRTIRVLLIPAVCYECTCQEPVKKKLHVFLLLTDMLKGESFWDLQGRLCAIRTHSHCHS